MPTFRITAPNGVTYEVDAPEGATEQEAIDYATRHAPADGSAFQWLPENESAPQAPYANLPKAPPRGMMWQAADFMGKFNDTLFGGLGDEIAGTGEVVLNALRAPFTDEEFDPSGAWRLGKDRFHADQSNYERDHPLLSSTASGLGLAGALAIPEAKIVQGANTAARIGNNAINGALWGTAAGLSQGEGTDRIRNATTGAYFGGAFGAAAEPIVSGLTGIVGGVRNLVTPYLSKEAGGRRAQAMAQREVSRALSNAEMTPSQAAGVVGERQARGIPASVSDLSDQTRQVTGWASRGVGPGQSAVRDAVRRKQENMASRMRQHIDDTLGTTVDPHGQSQALIGKAREDSSGLYAQAYETPVMVTPALREFMDSPIGPQALEAGANQIRMTPSAQRNVGSEQPFREGQMYDPGTGEFVDGQVPVLEAWDGAKRYLDDLEFQTGSKFLPNPSGFTSDTRAIDLRRRELLSELDAQVPQYAEARAAFAGPTQDRQAFLTGLEDVPGSARNTVDDARAQMDGMTGSQLDQFRLGDRTRLADRISGSKNSVSRWADATSPLNGNDARTNLLREVHGDEAGEQLLARAEAERQGHLTYKEVMGNSATAGRQAVDEGMDLATAAQATGQLFRGNPFSAAWTIATGPGGSQFGRYRSQLKDEVGRIMTETDLPSVEETMRKVTERQRMDAEATERLQKIAALTGRWGTAGVVRASGDETGMYDTPPSDEPWGYQTDQNGTLQPIYGPHSGY